MAQPARERLDRRLAELGLASTREKAQALVLAGRVRVDGRVVDKAGTPVAPDAIIEVVAPEHPWVGRGGVKLQGALDAFAIAPDGKTCLDLGASTGGFSDCLLQRGARRVHAVDVGHGLLDPRVRNDPRVVVHERTNARYLDRAAIPEAIDLAVMDLAFISVRLVLPAVVALLGPAGDCVVLVKPQFELGRGEVGRGVVRDPERHARAILSVAEAARSLGLCVSAVAASPILGQKGNREFFLHLSRTGAELGDRLEAVVRAVAMQASAEVAG